MQYYDMLLDIQAAEQLLCLMHERKAFYALSLPTMTLGQDMERVPMRAQ